MAAELPDYEQIERYLSGDMEPAEQQAFESLLNQDPDAMQKLQTYKNLQQEYGFIEQSKPGEEALNHTFVRMKQKYFAPEEKTEKKTAPVRKMMFALAAAASVLIAFFLLKPVLFPSGNKDLFAQYYEDEQFTVRGGTDSAATASAFYDQRDYARTLQILEPFTQAHPEKIELVIFKGKCYLQTNQYNKAEEIFTALVNGNAPQMYREKAQWLHALLMLKQERKEDCRKLLIQIPEKSYYYKKAKQLLDDL